MPTADRPTTKQLYENIGRGIATLAVALSDSARRGARPQDNVDLGKQVDALIRAALKAVLPGSQSTKQVTALQQQARQAFARALARRVKKLGAAS